MQRSEFTPFQMAFPPQLDLAEFPLSIQYFLKPVPGRFPIFSSRILLNFADQWRLTIRSSYEEYTILRLAKIIISIMTFDFLVHEVFTPHQWTASD